MGSLSRVQVVYTDLKVLLTNIPEGLPVYGALLEGKPINEVNHSKKGLIIIGSEAHGISKDIIPLISDKITIPLLSSSDANKPESLNASVACAIICYALKISN